MDCFFLFFKMQGLEGLQKQKQWAGPSSKARPCRDTWSRTPVFFSGVRCILQTCSWYHQGFFHVVFKPIHQAPLNRRGFQGYQGNLWPQKHSSNATWVANMTKLWTHFREPESETKPALLNRNHFHLSQSLHRFEHKAQRAWEKASNEHWTSSGFATSKWKNIWICRIRSFDAAFGDFKPKEMTDSSPPSCVAWRRTTSWRRPFSNAVVRIVVVTVIREFFQCFMFPFVHEARE